MAEPRDARQLPDGQRLEAEVCIIGAGAAGITLARELAGTGRDVLLCESGGLEPDPEVQALAEGENVGRRYFDLTKSRLRLFGGSTNHWAGWCRPLDPEDMTGRRNGHTGWPIAYENLLPYYRRAQTICQLGPFERYRPEGWSDAPTLLCPDSDRVATRVYQFSPPTNFGQVYRSELWNAPDIRILLHATAAHLETGRTGGSIRGIRIRTLEGREHWVEADLFVLATGGIENPRLLMASGLGRDRPYMGRCFMEHPHAYGAYLLPAPGTEPPPLYRLGRRRTHRSMGVLVLDPETRRREDLLNFSAGLSQRRYDVSDPIAYRSGYDSFETILREAADLDVAPDFWSHVGTMLSDLDGLFSGVVRQIRDQNALHIVYCRCEQEPNMRSRISLAPETDAVGVPKVRLDWALTERDLRTVHRGTEILAEEFGRDGIGRFHQPESSDALSIAGGFHHMGTTRMSASPGDGVVDPHGRLHGVDNLYVAGSSVFPTSGSANPTLTIVALTLRLADHLKEVA